MLHSLLCLMAAILGSDSIEICFAYALIYMGSIICHCVNLGPRYACKDKPFSRERENVLCYPSE